MPKTTGSGSGTKAWRQRGSDAHRTTTTRSPVARPSWRHRFLDVLPLGAMAVALGLVSWQAIDAATRGHPPF